MEEEKQTKYRGEDFRDKRKEVGKLKKRYLLGRDRLVNFLKPNRLYA